MFDLRLQLESGIVEVTYGYLQEYYNASKHENLSLGIAV